MRLRLLSILLLLLFSFQTATASATSDASKSIVSELLSWVKLKTPDIKDESEAVRQAVIRDSANLDAALGSMDAALQADLKDPNDREIILSLAAIQDAATGKIDEADLKLFMMKNALYKIDAHTGIAKTQFTKDEHRAQSDLDNANELLFNLTEGPDKLDRQKKLAVVQLEGGYLLRALALIADVSKEGEKAEILSELLMRAKDKEQYKKLKYAIDLTQNKFIRDALSQKLAAAEAKAGLLSEAAGDIENLSAPQKVDAYLEIALIAFSFNKQAEVKALLEKVEFELAAISDDADKSTAYGALAAAQSKMGMAKNAVSNFHKMRSYTMHLRRDNIERTKRLILLSEGQLNNGQPLEAYINFYEARNSLYEASATDSVKAGYFSSIGKGVARLDHASDAKEFFAIAKTLALKAELFEIKFKLFHQIAADQMESKMKDEAFKTLDQIVNDVTALDDRKACLGYYQKVALLYVQYKELDRAVRLMDQIAAPLEKGDLLKTILFENAKWGEVQTSIQTAQKQPSIALTMRGYLGVAFGILMQPEKRSPAV